MTMPDRPKTPEEAGNSPCQAKPQTLSPEERRAMLFARRYPALEAVPPEKRAAMVRKAFLHPLCLLALAAAAFVFLPESIAFIMDYLHLATETQPEHQGWKILVAIAIPSVFLFLLLRHAVLPMALDRVLRREGY